MKLAPLQASWSQRQQVLAIIVGAAGVLFLLWFFLLAPLNLRRRRLEHQIQQMQAQLAEKNYLVGEEALFERKAEVQRQYNRLYEEWREMRTRLAADAADGGEGEGPGVIDFKVKLFEVRQRLLRKSRDLRIGLPRDLGMDDAVYSNEDARKLMHQLRAMEKLVDLFLDLKVSALREILPLPPRPMRLGADEPPYLEEYPVDIEFYGSLEHLYGLFRAIYEAQHVFVLRRVRVEATSPTEPDLLRMRAQMGALVFLGEPRELSAPVDAKVVYRRPLGI